MELSVKFGATELQELVNAAVLAKFGNGSVTCDIPAKLSVTATFVPSAEKVAAKPGRKPGTKVAKTPGLKKDGTPAKPRGRKPGQKNAPKVAPEVPSTVEPVIA